MVLFTSAAPGKKAAPKVAPRRRPQPAAQSLPSLTPTLPPTPSNAPAQCAVVEQPSGTNSIRSTIEPEHAASQPTPEPTVEQAQIGSVSTITTQPISIVVSAPVVAKSPQPTPIRLPEPPPVPIVVAAQPTPPSTQAQSTPEPRQEPTSAAVQSRTASDESATGTAIAGAQQRLEDYYVRPDAEVEVQPPEEAPKTKQSTSKAARLESTAEVSKAASGPTTGAKRAPKRKARALLESTTEAPQPTKRSRRVVPTETARPPPTDEQGSSTVSNTEATQDGEAGIPGDEAPSRNLRKQPTRKAGENNIKASGTRKMKTSAGKETRRGKRRKATAKSLEMIVDSDDENEVTDAAASPAPEQDDVDPVTDVEEGQPPRKRRKRATVEPRPKKLRTRKRKIRRPPVEGDEEEEQEEDSGSDPELHEIDPATVKMFDISKDSYHGKMSERGRAMDLIDWEAEKARRQAEAELIASGGQPEEPADVAVDGVVQSTEGADGTAEPAADNAEESQQTEGAAQTGAPAIAELETGNDDDNDGGIGFIVDDEGNIIEDPTTLVVNRQADAIAAAAADRPVEEINDLTTLHNRTTWMNSSRREPTDRVPLWKWKSDPWSEEQTDEFYDALRMFGTDFLIISKMFPPKTRRMIKAKFTREEKLDPQRINRALNGEETKKLDLDYYAQKTARDMSIFTKYDGLADAEKKINLEVNEKHAEITAELATAAAQEEQRAAEKRIQDTLEKSKAVKKARKSKKAVGGFGGFGGFGGGGGPDAGDDD